MDTADIVMAVVSGVAMLLIAWWYWYGCVDPCPKCGKRFRNVSARDDYYDLIYHCRYCGYKHP